MKSGPSALRVMSLSWRTSRLSSMTHAPSLFSWISLPAKIMIPTVMIRNYFPLRLFSWIPLPQPNRQPWRNAQGGSLFACRANPPRVSAPIKDTDDMAI